MGQHTQNTTPHTIRARCRLVAGMTGFEPAVSTLTGSHVRPLHHIPMWLSNR